jgi:hypothetical protein
MRGETAFARAAPRAIAVAIAVAIAHHAAHAHPAGAGAQAAGTASAAADLDQAFRAIRAAEVVGDSAGLGAWTGEQATPRVRARAALAAEAIRLRAAARTIPDAVAAEREIERLRAALLERLALDAPLAARELSLESAEDLLLRMHAIPYGDASVAVGLASPAELGDTRSLLATIEARLASPLVAPCFAPAAAIATDGAVFRAHALKGLAAALAADLARCESDGLGAEVAPDAARAAARDRSVAARADAQRLLARAASCELPVPEALGDILALARGRVERDAALRDRLLARAADSGDPATALVARVTRWEDAGGRGAFPSVGNETTPLDALARVGYAAELRAIVRARGGAESLAAPIERSLQRAGAESRDPAASMRRRRATAEWFAERLPADVRALGASSDAPAALFAVAALTPTGARLIDDSPEAAMRAASDPLVGPTIALRVAERLAARGDTESAADAVVAAIRSFDGLPAARDAMAIALDIRRTRGDAAALDDALSLAIDRFGDDPAAFGWRFERVDIALRGAGGLQDLGGLADLERASTLLGAVPTRGLDDSTRNNLFLRQIELEYARVAASGPPRSEAKREELIAQVAELGRTATAFDIQSLPAIDPSTSPWYTKTLPARVAAVRAAIALFTGDAIKACVLAERGYSDPFGDDATALRAAKTWIEAALVTGQPVHAPLQLRTFAARSPAFRDWLRLPLARLLDDAESALADGTVAKDPPGAIDALATLLSAGLDSPLAETRAAQALGRLAAVDRAGAERYAREALHAGSENRRVRWVLAEALRSRAEVGMQMEGQIEGQMEAFTLYRELSPLAAADRDRFWWRAQLAQLELLAAQPSLAKGQADIVARVNRLTALDATLGGPALAKRFEAVRAKALASGAKGGTAPGASPVTPPGSEP